MTEEPAACRSSLLFGENPADIAGAVEDARDLDAVRRQRFRDFVGKVGVISSLHIPSFRRRARSAPSARATLPKLRDAMKSQSNAKDAQAQSFLREAADLIGK